MKTKKSIKVRNSAVTNSPIQVADTINQTINYRQAGKRRDTEYPQGSIGKDLLQGNYIRYLIARYHQFRDVGRSFGLRPQHFSYAVIFKNIERKFKQQTYFISQSRFGELAAFLQSRIDNTILGRRNRVRGIPNYQTFDEFVLEQSSERQ